MSCFGIFYSLALIFFTYFIYKTSFLNYQIVGKKISYNNNNAYILAIFVIIKQYVEYCFLISIQFIYHLLTFSSILKIFVKVKLYFTNFISSE